MRHRLIKVSYNEEKPVFDINQPEAKIYQPGQGLGGSQVQVKRGDADEGMNRCCSKI